MVRRLKTLWQYERPSPSWYLCPLEVELGNLGNQQLAKCFDAFLVQPTINASPISPPGDLVTVNYEAKAMDFWCDILCILLQCSIFQ